MSLHSSNVTTIIDAAYQIQLGAQEWLDCVRQAITPRFGEACYVGEYRLSTEQGFTIPRFSAPEFCDDFVRQAFLSARPSERAAWVRQSTKHAGQYEILRELSSEVAETWRALPKPDGVSDFQFTQCLDGSDTMILLARFRDSLFQRDERDPSLLGVSAHVAAGNRLRRLVSDPIESACGIVSDDGHLISGTDELAKVREKIRSALERKDRARARRSRLEPSERVALWDVLVDGNWSLVDYFDTDGKRMHLLLRNAPSFTGPPSLSARERQVAHLASHGLTNQAISFALGTSQTTVANSLKSALRRLGLRRRTDLPWLVESCTPRAEQVLVADDVVVWANPLDEVKLSDLSPSERDVLKYLIEGRSDAEIASSRGTSDRTVANQIRAISAKLGVSGRVEIVATLRNVPIERVVGENS